MKTLSRHSRIHKITAWNFHGATPVLRGSAGSLHRPPALAAFRTIGQSFFEAESKREYRLEAVLFGLIAALALWPIVLAVQAGLVLIR